MADRFPEGAARMGAGGLGLQTARAVAVLPKKSNQCGRLLRISYIFGSRLLSFDGNDAEWSLIRGLEAFGGDTPSHVNSQVTQLLCMARGLLHYESDWNEPEDLYADAYDLGVPLPRQATKTSLSLSLSTLTRLALSSRQEGQNSPETSDELYVSEAFQGYVETRTVSTEESFYRDRELDDPTIFGAATSIDIIERLYSNIFQYSSSRSGFALLNISMTSSHERVRTASAAALFHLHKRSEHRVRPVLEEALESSDEIVRLMAETSFEPRPEYEYPTQQDPSKEFEEKDENKRRILGANNDEDDSVSVVLHGTFARLSETGWYKPTADLPRRIRKICSKDLYHKNDYFRWSGQYSKRERTAAAAQLVEWCRAKGIKELETVYAHSHGGNVIMEAIECGDIRVRLLVLLHVPILPRNAERWKRIENRTAWIIDLRNPFDWVVWVDILRNRGLNGFGNKVRCVSRMAGPLMSRGYVTNSHGYYLDDKTWDSYDLADEILYERAMITANRAAASLPTFT